MYSLALLVITRCICNTTLCICARAQHVSFVILRPNNASLVPHQSRAPKGRASELTLEAHQANCATRVLIGNWDCTRGKIQQRVRKGAFIWQVSPVPEVAW